MEAALAGAEPLLTPPRSSPESPDRSSSPDSESGSVVLVRDMMSLPIRKRKLYSLRDEDEAAAVAAATAEKAATTTRNAKDLSTQRQSSVIQFAKAS